MEAMGKKWLPKYRKYDGCESLNGSNAYLQSIYNVLKWFIIYAFLWKRWRIHTGLLNLFYVFCWVCCYPTVLAHLISIFCASSQNEADNTSFLLFTHQKRRNYSKVDTLSISCIVFFFHTKGSFEMQEKKNSVCWSYGHRHDLLLVLSVPEHQQGWHNWPYVCFGPQESSDCISTFLTVPLWPFVLFWIYIDAW